MLVCVCAQCTAHACIVQEQDEGIFHIQPSTKDLVVFSVPDHLST